MNEIKGEVGELTFTVEVKRAATGKVERYKMIGKINGCDSQHGGKKRGD